MAKALRKKKAPITSVKASSSSHAPTSASSSSSTKPSAGTSALATRTLIRKFHVLLKRQAQLKSKIHSLRGDDDKVSSSKGKAKEGEELVELEEQLSEVENEMKELGGLDWYQRASTLGQAKERGGDSSHVLVSWLKELGRHSSHSKANPLKVLEIGALLPNNFASHPWIQNTPLDLHSRHPLITEQDFMDRPVPGKGEPLFDVVSCSLVLNFVPEARDRGRMLLHTLSFLPLPSTPILSLSSSSSSSSSPNPTSSSTPPSASYLFLVLPTPCVLNSRFLTPEHLTGLMLSIGYHQIRSRWKGEKGVAYWLFERVEPEDGGEGAGGEGGWGKKKILKGKGGCNNFAISLDV